MIKLGRFAVVDLKRESVIPKGGLHLTGFKFIGPHEPDERPKYTIIGTPRIYHSSTEETNGR